MKRCVTCKGTEFTATTRVKTYKFRHGVATVEIPAVKCATCGEGYLKGLDVQLGELAVARDLATMGPVNGETFAFMRSAMGMPAAALADLFNLRPETISRWENDKAKVDRAAHQLLATILLEQLEKGRTSTVDRLVALAEQREALHLFRPSKAAVARTETHWSHARKHA